MTASTWEPGDALYPASPYRQCLFNFRDDPAPGHPGPDAASWPEPASRYLLPADDELSVFIEAHHRWAASRGDAA